MSGTDVRGAARTRTTRETEISLEITVDGQQAAVVATSFAPLGHMLDALCLYAGIGGRVSAAGDVAVDPHHLIEDVGWVLGEAFDDLLSSREGIARYGLAVVPMDDALVRAALDFSGRAYCRLGGIATEVLALGTDLGTWREFFWAFCRTAGATLHLDVLAGENSHHVVEAMFKATGMALRQATALTGGGLLSTKGVIG